MHSTTPAARDREELMYKVKTPRRRGFFGVLVVIESGGRGVVYPVIFRGGTRSCGSSVVYGDRDDNGEWRRGRIGCRP